MEYLKRKWEEKNTLQKRVSVIIYILFGIIILLLFLGSIEVITFNLVNLIIVLLIGFIELLLGLNNYRDCKPASIVNLIAGIVVCCLSITGLFRFVS